MDGDGIDQWIEKLLPMFNGEHSLALITEGLPETYRTHIFDIAGTLYRNGFVRDLSQDAAHELPENIQKKYASQIEFLDHFGHSGGFRFQDYRQTKLLVVGGGTMLVALISALLDSGLPKMNVFIIDTENVNRQRITELERHARIEDPEVSVEEVHLASNGDWHELVKPYDCVVYVSYQQELTTFRRLHKACKEARTMFMPAICLQQVGLAGPLVQPNSDGCWESAWRRIHQSALRNRLDQESQSKTAEAMLANTIVFECFKSIGGIASEDQRNQVFVLDLMTLEGNWHTFAPHPLVTGQTAITRKERFEFELERPAPLGKDGLLPFFGGLTSEQTGLFHRWEEGDLLQLPLAQCRVQAVDPLSGGPAGMLPELICAALTHEEARRESGLAGIEAYATRMVESLQPNSKLGIGAGETVAESICRGLLYYLTSELVERLREHHPFIRSVQLVNVEDEQCGFYLRSLTIMAGEPQIGIGDTLFGFPVVWVGTRERWVGSCGLNVAQAFRQALEAALHTTQNPTACGSPRSLEAVFVSMVNEPPIKLHIPALNDSIYSSDDVRSAWLTLKEYGIQPVLFDLELEPFFKEHLAGVIGVQLREEAAQ